MTIHNNIYKIIMQLSTLNSTFNPKQHKGTDIGTVSFLEVSITGLYTPSRRAGVLRAGVYASNQRISQCYKTAHQLIMYQ